MKLGRGGGGAAGGLGVLPVQEHAHSGAVVGFQWGKTLERFWFFLHLEHKQIAENRRKLCKLIYFERKFNVNIL